MQVSSASIAIGAFLTLSLPGCDPTPKNVGNGLGTDSATTGTSNEGSTAGSGDETADGGTQSGGIESDEPLWVSVLPGGQLAPRMARMPDGGVVVATVIPGSWLGAELIRYSSSGDIVWQRSLGHSIYDIETLDDGRIFAAGMIDQGGLRAAVWRLSPAGATEALQIHPLPGALEEGHSGAYSLSVNSTGVAYDVIIGNPAPDVPRAEVWRADLDLSTQWSWSDFEDDPLDVVLLPSGELRTLEHTDQEGLADFLMRSFAEDGTPLGTESLPPAHFADDAPLVQVGISDEGVWIQGLENASELLASFPGYANMAVATSTHGPGVGISLAGDDDVLTLLQRAPDGQTRELVLPAPCFDLVAGNDVALGLDGSMYVSGFCLPESQPPIEEWAGFVLALPPI